MKKYILFIVLGLLFSIYTFAQNDESVYSFTFNKQTISIELNGTSILEASSQFDTLYYEFPSNLNYKLKETSCTESVKHSLVKNGNLQTYPTTKNGITKLYPYKSFKTCVPDGNNTYNLKLEGNDILSFYRHDSILVGTIINGKDLRPIKYPAIEDVSSSIKISNFAFIDVNGNDSIANKDTIGASLRIDNKIDGYTLKNVNFYIDKKNSPISFNWNDGEEKSFPNNPLNIKAYRTVNDILFDISQINDKEKHILFLGFCLSPENRPDSVSQIYYIPLPGNFYHYSEGWNFMKLGIGIFLGLLLVSLIYFGRKKITKYFNNKFSKNDKDNKSAIIELLKKDLESQDIIIAEKEKTIEEKEKTISQLMTQLTAADSTSANQALIDSLNNQLQQARKDLEEAKKQLASSNSLTIDTSTLDQLRVQLQQANNQITLITKQKNEVAKQLNASIKNNKDKENQIASLQNKLKNDYILKSEAKKQKDQLDNLYKKEQAKGLSLSKENEALSIQVSTLSNNCNNLKDQILSLIRNRDELASQINALHSAAEQPNIFYLNLIKETMLSVSKLVSVINGRSIDEELRSKLITPVLKGASTVGLPDGVLSYGKKFESEVLSKLSEFFGEDVYTMNSEKVKTILVEKFLLPILKHDSFNKLVRLALYANTGWIRTILVNGGIDVDHCSQAFYRIQYMLEIFGIQLIYPVLFVDSYSEGDRKYRWNDSSDIFDYFGIPEDIRSSISHTEIIVDYLQVGFIQNGQIVRQSIISTPSF